MKKFFGLIALLVLAVVLVACETKTYEVAMITDTGDIDDGSFNQGTWEGIKKYGEENKKTYQYYKPGGESTADYVQAIDLAVAGGAKIVITPGFYFEVPIFQAQAKYPDVKFVILDGAPHDTAEGSPIVVGKNTLSVFFKEEQSGFLAGYASVKEGLLNLGFMGGIAVPAVQRFGIGYVAGAYKAAQEAGTPITFTADHYTYVGTFGQSDEVKAEATVWFSTGKVDVIHAAAGGAGTSVMLAAAELQNKWVVGVDSDQSGANNRVITSAVKGVGAAAYQAVDAFYKNSFPGGQTWNLGATEGAVSLPMGTSRFTKFNQAQYDAVFAQIVNKTISVPATKEALATYLTGLGVVNPELIAKV